MLLHASRACAFAVDVFFTELVLVSSRSCPVLSASPNKGSGSKGTSTAVQRGGANQVVNIDNAARKPMYIITSSTSHRPLVVGDIVSIDLSPRCAIRMHNDPNGAKFSAKPLI